MLCVYGHKLINEWPQRRSAKRVYLYLFACPVVLLMLWIFTIKRLITSVCSHLFLPIPLTSCSAITISSPITFYHHWSLLPSLLCSFAVTDPCCFRPHTAMLPILAVSSPVTDFHCLLRYPVLPIWNPTASPTILFYHHCALLPPLLSLFVICSSKNHSCVSKLYIILRVHYTPKKKNTP